MYKLQTLWLKFYLIVIKLLTVSAESAKKVYTEYDSFLFRTSDLLNNRAPFGIYLKNATPINKSSKFPG